MAGARSPDELCLAAERAGYGAIALCDAASMYGLPALVDAAAERGLKALAGASFRLPDGRALYVWALDRAGYGRLCRLTSAARGGDPAKAAEGEPLAGGIRGGEAGPPASEAAGLGRPAGVAALGEGLNRGGGRGSGDSGGPEAAPRFPQPSGWAAVRAFNVLAALEGLGLDGLAVAAASEPALRRLAALPGAAGGEGAGGPRARASGGRPRPGGLYVALESFAPMARAARLAARLGLRPLAVVAGRVLDPACDHERLRLLAAVERRVTVSALEAAGRAEGAAMDGAADGLPEPDEPPLPGAARAAALYSAYPEAVAAAQELAAAAAPAAAFFSAPPAFPRWRGLPEDEAYRALRAACEEGAARRYGPAWRSRADLVARLTKELRIIAAKGFSSYFLVVRDIVALCPRTCGRGSAASSVVSYLLSLSLIHI